MFRFDRKRILKLFFDSGMTVRQLAIKAGVNQHTAYRAVEGLPVHSQNAVKIARAFGIDVIDYLVKPFKVEEAKTL